MEIIEIIKESIDITIIKQNPNLTQQEFKSIEKELGTIGLSDIINRNNYAHFTSTNNARGNMIDIGQNAIIVELIRGAFLSYGIDTLKGNVRDLSTGPNGYPNTPDQAINYIFNELNSQESPSLVYTELQKNYNDNLRNLLIKSYATLVSDSTKEERMQVYTQFAPYFNEKLRTLDNLQISVMKNPSLVQNSEHKINY